MNRTALITGATGGLGEEFSRLLAERKYDLVLTARNEEKLRSLKENLEAEYGIRVYLCPADLSETEGPENVFAYTEGQGLSIDILVNNAGFGDNGRFTDSSWQKQYGMVQVNILSLMRLTYLYMKPMMDRGYGSILNVASVAAFSSGPYMSVYYASKAFVRSFSEAMAEEARGTGVTVTAVCPGPTATGFEKAASMKNRSMMFRFAGKASAVAEAAVLGMEKGRALVYPGAFVKAANIGSRLMPRAVSRVFAGFMNRQ